VHIKGAVCSHSSVTIFRRQERKMMWHAAESTQACDGSMCLSSAACLVMFWLLVRSRKRRKKRDVEGVKL
jgi:hypothetical protein